MRKQIQVSAPPACPGRWPDRPSRISVALPSLASATGSAAASAWNVTLDRAACFGAHLTA